MPRATSQAAIHAALQYANRTKAIDGAISVMAQGLANRELSTMWLIQIKTVAVATVAMAFGTLATAAALLTQPVAKEQPLPSRLMSDRLLPH